MGRAKQDEIEYQERVQSAVGLCVEVGAVKPCDVHEEQMIDQMAYGSPEEVMEVILDQNPEALSSFKSREDMLDCVTDALADAGDECGICANYRDSGCRQKAYYTKSNYDRGRESWVKQYR
jgi:hypothetical protein